MIVHLDVDGVVADFMSAILKRYNESYHDDLCPNDIRSWDLHDYVKSECGKDVYGFINNGLYDIVEPVKGALKFVEKLRAMGHRVVFTTAGVMEGSRKYRWLFDHGFLNEETKDDFVSIEDKSLLNGDLLIDDGPHNVLAFKNRAILVRKPHNTCSNFVPAVMYWEDILTLVEEFSNQKDEKKLHPTEERYPEQTAGFLAIIEKMYVTHLEKNQDYSPANILGTGEVGLMTRVWDKVARLMSLNGFQITISESSYTKPKAPKNESIEDTLLDISVYTIIWHLLRKGLWGK